MADDDPETTAVGDMGKRLGLLGGQDQILRLGAGKGCIAVADVIVIAARCSRCSTSSKSRVVKRSPPRTSYVSVRPDRYPFQRHGSRSSTFVIL